MGNTQTNGNGNYNFQSIEECLLRSEEVSRLQIGDKFDHRDCHGLYSPATVIKMKISNNKIMLKIKYEDYPQDKYDKWINYEENGYNRYSFAKYKSISRRPATSELAGCHKNDCIQFKYKNEWKKAKIVRFDSHSGQIQIEFKFNNYEWKKRWTHLDNKYEIQSLNKNGSQHGSHNNYYAMNNDNNMMNCCHDNNKGDDDNFGYKKEKIQIQDKKQDQMTIETQLLLDDTIHQLQLTKDYLDAVCGGSYNKQELSRKNQNVVTGLTLFQMKVNGMRDDDDVKHLDFTNAFKSCSMLIKQFEQEYKQQYGTNQVLMKRLEPCLNYMTTVLMGKTNIPPLPYIKKYKFDVGTASRVMSAFNYSINHVLPDRMNEINNNNKQYKQNQQELKQQYEDEQHKQQVTNINYNNLIQDFDGDVEFAMNKQKQDAMIEKDMKNYRFKQPDLVNGDGNSDNGDNGDNTNCNHRNMNVDIYDDDIGNF